MNVNLPKLVNAALAEDQRGNKNVAIVSDNWTAPNHRDAGFLSRDFPKDPPRLIITAESDDFDQLTLAAWQDEGFLVEYLPMGDSGPDDYTHRLRELSTRKMGPCQTFGIIAFGDAASLCLEHYHVLDNNPDFKLGCLIAYYPTRIPDPDTKFPSAINVLVHLVEGEVDVVKQTQMIGIQGKKRLVKTSIGRGIGTGGSLHFGYPGYAYEVEEGFAERDLDEYDRISAELAWSRSLATARRAFGIHVDVEVAVEVNTQSKFFARNLQQTMSTYTSTVHCAPRVGHVPTLTGGIGTEELQDFYDRYFIHSNPDSWDVTLLSRTVGVDRVVDEMHVFFRHTQEMPWILPGVPPTDKKVEIIMVSIVALRGGRLHHEHVYWDQASVLVQVGLLDPRLVPAKARENGVLRLPAIGRTSARRVLNGIEDGQEGEADNGLIYEWEDAQESEEEDEEDTEDEDDQSEEGGESQADNTVKASTDGDKKGKEVEKPQTELDDGTNNSLSSEATDDNTHGENGEKSHDWRRASVVEGTDSS